ncbi:MAG: Tim44 domain-containing protein [Betaproteobacteria bacterium]|nr:Tim44 domain-containing protein [Betaproteobacteria bacterium]
MKLWALALAVALTLSGFDAEAARRLGGGKSFGKQSSNVTQREAASPAPASPAAPGQSVNNAAAKPTPAAAPAAAQAPKRPWGAMLGGLAAGLGLAWLASSLGLGEAFGNVLGSMIGSALMGSQTWGVPAGFDTEGFLKSAKANFVTLQAAWDRSDVAALRAMMTDDMTREIQTQLAERETHTGAGVNHTDVVMIDARLLGIEELPDEYMASVEFSGMIREEPSAGPSPFREVWNMTKAKNGSSGWLVAGVQALQ